MQFEVLSMPQTRFPTPDDFGKSTGVRGAIDMGGHGSGWKWASKIQVEQCLILSAARLQSGGTLRPNQTVRGTITWRNGYEEVVGVFDFEARLKETEGEFEPIEPGRQWGSHWISLVTTPLPWGGLRWWFMCPLRGNYGNGCWHRVGKLYLPPGGNTFGCRHCYNLSYWSRQTSAREDRLWKADLRLMGEDGANGPRTQDLTIVHRVHIVQTCLGRATD